MARFIRLSKGVLNLNNVLYMQKEVPALSSEYVWVYGSSLSADQTSVRYLSFTNKEDIATLEAFMDSVTFNPKRDASLIQPLDSDLTTAKTETKTRGRKESSPPDDWL